jgi:hypothetical protein
LRSLFLISTGSVFGAPALNGRVGMPVAGWRSWRCRSILKGLVFTTSLPLVQSVPTIAVGLPFLVLESMSDDVRLRPLA